MAPPPAGGPAPIEPPTVSAQPSVQAAPDAAGARAREFEGTELGTVLRLLARQARINLVISDKVLATPSTVTIRLEDVTAVRAIEIICQSKNLLFLQDNNIYYVKDQSEKALEPVESDFYTFSYANAAKAVALVEGQMQAKIKPQVDERTNTIYFTEFKSNAPKLREFVRRLDSPTKQVMIEARLVEVTANPRQSYGINWGGVLGSSASPQTFRYGATAPAGLVDRSQVFFGQPDANGLPTTTTIPLYNPDGTRAQGYGNPSVQFNANGSVRTNDFVRSGGIGDFGRNLAGQLAILSIPQMSATLRLLNEDTDAEFLANPRIVTANNLEATIKIVRKQPVPRLNFNEQTATAVFSGFEDKTFGNTLVVRPTINKDGYVTLSVKPEISNRIADQVFSFGGATVTSPIIDTRSLESNVLIKSGCTLAIGGLLQDETSKGRTKVPVLGDIPVLGYLFQERLNSRVKRNLLVFITPTIINQPYGTGLEDQVTGLRNSGDEFADPGGWRNNAKGAIRLIDTPPRPIAGEYPKPGANCAPDNKGVSFRDSAASRKR
ncbi:MAG: hypothetical protein JSR82_21965 [Verrucomicrobia bacterium]|nr:hypothetical protein [Verrucomicrobiota bacterium]